jgi:universal stress protein A
MKFDRILGAVDFSLDSLEAFRAAAEMAQLYSGSLLLLHVIEAQPSVSPDALVEINKRASDAMADLIAMERFRLERVAVSAEVTSGAAFEEIVHRARDWRAELVVVGAKGTTSLEEVIIGGTGEAVMKNAPCSVLVVRRRRKLEQPEIFPGDEARTRQR